MFPVDSENGLVDVVEKVKGNLAEEVLENFEKYWEDISDRLMISRMVSDSVIKGMVSAVEQDAAEKIAAKELEVVQRAHEVVGKYGKFSCSSKKNEKIREELNALRNLARDQFDKVKEEIERAKIGSDSESESGINHVNKMLDCLKTKLDTVCGKVDDILLSSKISFCESQENQDLLAKLEEFEDKSLSEQNAQFCGIIQNMNWLEKFNDISSLGTKLESILKSLETGLVSDHGSHDLDHLHHKTSLCGENVTEEDASNIHVGESYDFQQLKHMSNEELVNYFKNIITKMKRDHESELQQKTEELFRLKREYPKEKRSFVKDEEFDVLRKKIPEVISKLNDFLLENERFPALITDNLESMGKLKHKLESLMSENHRLRDCLADMENEVKCLKAQVSGAAVAEENMLKENLKSEVEDSCIKASLNEEIYKSAVREQIAQTRLESLISENHQLRDSLTDMDNAVKCLKEQLVSGAAAKMLRHSPVEEDILKLLENLKSALEDSCIKASLNEEIYKSAIREQIAQTRLESLTSENRRLRDRLTDTDNLKSAVEDSCIEASLNEEIYKSAIREQMTQIRCDSEDSNMEFLITREIYDIILREAAVPAETAKRSYGIEDSDIESSIIQELNGLIFTETIRDAGRKLNNLYWKVVVDEEIRIFLETKALEMENELTLEVEEKEKFRTAMKQEEMLAMDLSVLLSKERERVSRELISLQELASRQEKDLESLRSQYSGALKQIEVDKMEVQKLNQKLDQTKVELTEANRERNEASTLAQEMCDKLLLSEAREQTLKKGMEMAADGFSKIFDDFEGRVSEAMNKNNLRLEDASSQLKALTEMAKGLRRTEQMYKLKLERRCSDLRMAEAEVDLLGDEVDACLSLLEKIYIALDHYSPVLKHYSGIIEILELVRKELSGESTIPTVVNSMARMNANLQ